jgi:sulfur carrier protein ThiS
MNVPAAQARKTKKRRWIMKVNLKCFADLAERFECDYRETRSVDLSEGATVNHVLEHSGIPKSDVRIVFVNGQVSESNRTLRNGDRVTLVPATGGM